MDSGIDKVTITRDSLVLEDVLRSIGHTIDGTAGDDAEAGALVVFSGLVRATEGARTIDHLDYEHYAGMAEKEVARLIDAARARWPLRRVAVFHRTGAIKVSEASVVVAVSAGHRGEAFEAARYLIDELKKSVPIWKAAPTE